jgi:hypothetical protein
MWHAFVDRNTYPGKAQVLGEHCASVGRDPETIVRSAGVQDSGGIDAMLAEADALADLGVTILTVGVNGPDYDLASAEALIRWRDGRNGG